MKSFLRVLSAIVALAAFVFMVKFLTTPSTIHFVNFHYDEIMRYVNDNRESYHALIDYTFHSQIKSFGYMLAPDAQTQMSAYFNTKITDKSEDGFVYVYDDSNGIPLQWGNYDLDTAEKSHNTYTIKTDAKTIKIIPIRDNLYYFNVVWPDQRPTNTGG